MKLNLPRTLVRAWLFCLLGALLLPGGAWAALTVTVVDDKGTPITNFRWILQEDISAPGRPYERRLDTVSIVSHRTDARVIATGNATSSAWPVRVPKYTLQTLVPERTILAGPAAPAFPYNDVRYDADPDPAQKYAIEVMASGYSVGGQTIAAGQTTVKVIMNRNPLPTTQISILVFHDHRPLNNEPDAEEEGLAGKVKLHVIPRDGSIDLDPFKITFKALGIKAPANETKANPVTPASATQAGSAHP